MEFDEAVDRDNAEFILTVFPVAISYINLRLLRVRAKREARFQFFEVFNAIRPVVIIHARLGF